ncbi:MAG: heparinase II/III family protein [Pikeienuella sp.]
MTATDPLRRPTRADRIAVRLARLGKAPNAVVTSPEPLWTGDAAAAKRLAGGLFLLGGAMVEAPDVSPWDITAPTAAWSDALHDFRWLDDVAAADPVTRAALTEWVHEWVARYGKGKGPGWHPDLTGSRLARWICHAPLVLSGAGPDKSRAFFKAIGVQARYLRRRWRHAPQGLPRFQAASGLIYAGLALEGGTSALLNEGITALGKEGQTAVAEDGGVASRNPEHLVEIFAILTWAAQALQDAGQAPANGHTDAMARLANAIRALRLGDGHVARFHGGGGSDAERIDRALATSGLRPTHRQFEVMGFHRVSTARSTIIFDGGMRPTGPAAAEMHASAFCFEASIGRRPVIVNCGPGGRMSEEWRTASRATAAHSGLTIDDRSSARLEGDLLLAGARDLRCIREEDADGVRLFAQHDGYLKSHGLIHQRRLTISADGGDIRGEDNVTATGPGPKAAFDQAAGKGDRMAVPFTIRFHLHPDVSADVFLAGSAVRLALVSGDIWIMRQLGGDMTIEDSVYIDEARVAPRATKQIVVRALATEYAGHVKWAFRRAEPEKPAPRDVEEASV